MPAFFIDDGPFIFVDAPPFDARNDWILFIRHFIELLSHCQTQFLRFA